jgi:chromosome segregation protein
MQLLSLTITGFKSFAKPTRLDFAPGITCVVGPNGCGKSNIVDAVRWVLGEQRSSVLRGERMENVIFNGTASRKPAGMADVQITLDNHQGVLGIPSPEVEIARRLFRDGTSEYLLNSKECRLKDVSDLLHDSGMGPNLYTILELKMVEDILREEGEGRRALFEEAAGVAKYKLRRRQALQKLRQTEEDLVRLADILSEVERQVSSLKRQAMRARRYEELAKQLHALEAAVIYRDYQRLLGELNPLEAVMKQSSAATDAAKGAIRLEESRVLELRTREIEIDKETRTQREKLAAVVSEISALEAEEAGLRAREQAAGQTIERTKRERHLLAEKRTLLEARCSEIRESHAECQHELQGIEAKLASAGGTLNSAEETMHEAERRTQEHAESLSALRHRLSERQDAAAQIALRRAGHASRKEMLERELETISHERDSINARLQDSRHQLSLFDADEQAARSTEQELTRQIEAKRAELSNLEEKTRQLTTLAEAIQAKLDLLHTLEEKGPRSHRALRALKSNPVPGLLDLLGDTIDVDDRYRCALQAALGPAAYYYLTESVEAALSAMEMLRREKAGQTTFLPLSEFLPEPPPAMELPEDVLGTALDVLSESPHNAILQHFLGRVIIVQDWDTALRHYAWAKERGCTLVTLDGQWIGGRGLLRGGSEDPDLPADLGLVKQMAELRDRLDSSRQESETARIEARSLRGALAHLEQEMTGVRRKLDERSSGRQAVREQQVALEARLAALEERGESARAQIAEIEELIRQCEQDLSRAQDELESAKREISAAESAGAELAAQLSLARKQVAEAQDAKHAVERERDGVQHRADLLAADDARLEQTLAEIAGELTSAEQHAEQAAQELVGLESRLREIDTLSVEKFRARDAAAQEVERIAAHLDDVRNRIAEQEERLRQLRDSHAGELEGEKRIELDMARLRGELDALLTSARTQFAFDLAAPDFAEQHPTALDPEATPELLQECRQKIERLGPVNPLALEEYAQENARLNSMIQQRNDLLKAKQTLEETIARINETAQARFLHTFEGVRAHFQRLFQEFFPAGEADLILSGQDLLEADITLWANPSGKRLKSLSLMSGGEKTMTAIALLFALYQVKPSPFCVFDEVDAPLDDASIDRFNRVIRMHSQNTQFILITHNRRTMEIADNLYGVTMEEEGVSKLVSVRLLSSVA